VAANTSPHLRCKVDAP